MDWTVDWTVDWAFLIEMTFSWFAAWHMFNLYTHKGNLLTAIIDCANIIMELVGN